MKEVFKILRQLESTSSRNAKKDILAQHQGNELLKKYFLYAYDDRRVYGIGTKSIRAQKLTASQEAGLYQKSLFQKITTDIFELLDELVTHPFGSDEDVQAVNNFLSRVDVESFDWYKRLILKDLKIGCTASTINDVWNNYIPTFDVMLAHPYHKHADKIVGAFQLQKKLDGFRLIVYKYPDGTARFFTRNGLELFDFPQIAEDLKTIFTQNGTVVFDGECIANDKFNDTQKLIMRKDPKIGLVYNIFDVVAVEEWEGELSDLLFKRYDILQEVVPKNLEFVKVVEELYRGTDIAQIAVWFNYAKANGWEGIMVKLNAPYARKRTTNMLKVKEFDTLDLRVIRLNEGTGKNIGKLGSVTVNFVDGAEVDVGSGFEDYDRERFWQNPELILDKIIEVQYFEKTANERGIPSLRFPVFKRIRYDK